METAKFDPNKTLRRTKPETILKWAVAKLREELKSVQESNAEYLNKRGDEYVIGTLGKRDSKKLADGKITVAEIRKSMLDKENAGDAAKTEQAIAAITQAFAVELPEYIRVDVNWTKSRTWGNCPQAEVWAGERTSSNVMSGWGYDKESAATADAFNLNPVFARIVATCAWLDMKESKATGKNETTYGYSVNYLGYRFNGGVGYSCHDRIIRRAGYKLKAEFHPNTSDGYQYVRE